MIRIKETVKLLRVKVIYNGKNIWQMDTVSDTKDNFIKRQEIIFKGTEEEFKKLLKKMQAKDTATSPASFRSITYQQMIDGIKNRTDNEIWIWSNVWNNFNSVNKFLTIGNI